MIGSEAFAATELAATATGRSSKEGRPASLGPVLLAAGVVGFFIGAVGYADWQAAVEASQVVAGLVRYPPENPFFLYQTQLWSMLHQILAPLLWLGMSERTASLLVSGMLGTLSLQAIATVILAIGRDPWLAAGGAVAVFFAGSTEFGVAYPVWFVGTSHTYGIVGMSYLVLVIGLLGGGWLGAGGFLLGLAPAVHPSLGLWLGVIVTCCLLCDPRRLREFWLPVLRPFLCGGAVTTASLLIQRFFISKVPPGAGPVPPDLYLTFITSWDYHRRPIPWDHPGVIFNGVVLAAALFWLYRRPETFPGTSRILPRAAVTSSLLGLAATALSWLPPERIPQALLILMPTRVLNVAIILSLPLLIGMLGRDRRLPWQQLLLLALLVGTLLGGDVRNGVFAFFSSRLWDLLLLARVDVDTFSGVMVNPWGVMALVTAGLGIATARIAGGGPGTLAVMPGTAGPGWSAPAVATWLRRTSLSLLALIVVLAALFSWLRHERGGAVMEDRTDNPVLATAAAGDGLLLTGGDLHLIQLRTRRPVLIDGGGLDGIAYVPGALPAMAEIVSKVYRIDFAAPPREARGRGVIPAELVRAAWEPLPPAFWRAVRMEYGVNEVLTEADWDLQLPLLSRDRSLALYRIPPP
jgi:hypothetical protein